MEFVFKSLRLPDTDERIEVATRVEFEDTAELTFAIACIDAVRLYIEIGSHDIDQSLRESASESYEKVSARLRSLMEPAVDINQTLITHGMIALSKFVSEDQETANAVNLCTRTIRNNPEVREYFPEAQSDLLTIFVP